MSKRRIINCNKVRRCARVFKLEKENRELKEQIKELKARIEDLRRNLYWYTDVGFI